MKKLILGLLLFGFFSSGHSQILLKETNIDYRRESMKLDPVTNRLILKVYEKSVGEFEKDPLTFMRNNLDVQRILEENKDGDFASFKVIFRTTKGNLVADFDKSGNLESSSQRFRNVRLPERARLQIIEKYRDAAILGNTYVATTKGWDFNKEYFKVKIKDGNRTRRVQVNVDKDLLSLSGL